MIGAGLLAKKAVAKGLRSRPWVKTSLAPGSRVVTDYLRDAGLTPVLDQLGFQTVGYGCTTCIGNSGPLPEPVARAIEEHSLVVAAVLSGNRNFEARVHPLVRANYLASPMLVVAFALLGRVDADLTTEPLGISDAGEPVFLRDIWPTSAEISEAMAAALTPALFEHEYAKVFDGDDEWKALEVPTGSRYAWDDASTYVQLPPFFRQLSAKPGALTDIRGRPGARRPRRLRHHRPHLAGRRHPEERPGRAVPPRARRRAARLEHLRRPARQPRSDDARHLRQRPDQERAGARQGRQLDGALPDRRGDLDLRRCHALRRGADAARGARRARNTAPARAATGPPRAPCSSA